MNMYKGLIRPRLFKRDPEEIHNRVLRWMRIMGKIAPVRECARILLTVRHPCLEQKLFDINFPNPVGLAAGMDKDGVALPGFNSLGFGFLEMGCVTAEAQPGNEKPRLFRLITDTAIINRMGFNGVGAEAAASNLESVRPAGILGVNIGKSKIVPLDKMDDVVADYGYTLAKLWPYADFFVVNVSSPNTPGLRHLQGGKFLQVLLAGIKRQSLKLPQKKFQRPKPILLKLAPDLTWAEFDEIIVVAKEVGIDGFVLVNTTTSENAKKSLKTAGEVKNEAGGLSGKPLQRRALEVVGYVHKKCPALPIIGVGGIFSAEDAYAMLMAGASLVQVYTGLVYEGPILVRSINKGLIRLFKRDGVQFIGELNPTVNRS